MALVILWLTTSFYLICFSCRSDLIGALLAVSELHLSEVKIKHQESSRTAVNYICGGFGNCGRPLNMSGLFDEQLGPRNVPKQSLLGVGQAK